MLLQYAYLLETWFGAEQGVINFETLSREYGSTEVLNAVRCGDLKFKQNCFKLQCEPEILFLTDQGRHKALS